MSRRQPPLTWRQRAAVAGFYVLAVVTAVGAITALGTGIYVAGIILTVLVILWLGAAAATPRICRERNRRERLAAAGEWELSW